MHANKPRFVFGTLGSGVTAAATVTANIDRLGYNSLTLGVFMGTANVVSNNPSTLKLAQSDITDATGFSDITAFVGDGVGGFVIPNSNTSIEHAIALFHVDCRAKKRYLKLSVSPLTTQSIAFAGVLGDAEENADRSVAASNALIVVAG